MARIMRRHPGCVVHLHLQGDAGGILVLLAARLAGAAATVRTLHNPPVPPVTGRLRLMVGVTEALTDRVICVSPETQRAQLKEYQHDVRKFAVIANGVDVERFSPGVPSDGAREELGIPAGVPLVGTIARLQEERKGVSDFIAMAARVARRSPDPWFVVVGEGPLRPALEAKAAELDIAARVVFTGYRRDVPRLLAAMDVAVFPSSYEAGQYVMLEAMAMARPVVVTPAGLAVDLVRQDVTGLLVPIHDVEAMAVGVARLLADRTAAARIGKAARDVVAAGYSTDAMVGSVTELYLSLIGGRSPLRPAPATAADLR
jgi:glycosyltransferase involved in cell wall biosynthesis